MTQFRCSSLACDIVAHLLIGERGVFAVTCNISCDPQSRADREGSQYTQEGPQLWTGDAFRNVKLYYLSRCWDSPVQVIWLCVGDIDTKLWSKILLCARTVDDGKVFWGLIVRGEREGEWALYHAAFYAAVHITLTLHTSVNTLSPDLSQGALLLLLSQPGAKWQRHFIIMVATGQLSPR